MDVLFAIFLAVHGLIHLLGFAKAFGLAELPQLTHPVAPLMGVLWLMAALLFMATAASLFVWPRAWWAVGACAIVPSMCAVVASWTDARFGALANLIALAGVAFGFLALGPGSLRAAFDREIDGRLGAAAPIEPLTLQDVAHLPAPVQRYLEVTGVIGQPRVRNFRVRMHGRIRSGPMPTGSRSRRSNTTSSTGRRDCSI